MALPGVLTNLFQYIDNHKSNYINNLREAVSIPSVSASPENRKDIKLMTEWTAKKLRNLGVEVTLREIGTQKLPNGEDIPLPPVLFGSHKSGTDKKTVLVYGHLDVQPARIEDGWETDPFVLTEKNGKLYGRGSNDDKGPVLCWIHALEAYKAIGEEIPVNIKFILEGMEEFGSLGLDKLLKEEKNKFLADVDYICVSDNSWLGTEKPCITYGLRGLCYFYVEVICASKDLHSGTFGGTVKEGMADLIYILNNLVDNEGHITIPGLYNEVAAVGAEERRLYETINFDVNEFRRAIGANKLAHGEVKEELLMHRWRSPVLSIHGIEGAFSDPGAKTVIPGKVIGKFSIRIVPNQQPEIIAAYVKEHCDKMWLERNSSNTYKVQMVHSGKPWLEDPNHPHYLAGRRATQHVYGVEPDLIREGGSIPVTLLLQEATSKNVILLSLGAADDGAHAQNEKMNIRNFVEGTKLLGAYLFEISRL